eukprot:400295_1
MSVSARPSIPPSNYVRLKILSLGSGGVGKSCLIKKYCEGKFVDRYVATIGVDYGVKTLWLSGHEVKINFWDVSGHPEFYEVRNEFYKDTQGILLVYDVTSRRSFEDLDAWLKESKEFGVKNPVVYVFANKIDAERRAVSQLEGQRWAKSKGFSYVETSAKTGSNVKEAFELLYRDVLAKVLSYMRQTNDKKLSVKNVRKTFK